jgi:DNA-binding LytR/AlgR family response regulator
VVDDEGLARQALRETLSGEQDIKVIGEASNGLEAVTQITELHPDLVFLDIEMPGLNGFEVVNSLERVPPTVFVTAYDKYAIQAFEVNAIDYLLKPVTSERVRNTLARVRIALQGKGISQPAALQQLVAELQRHTPRYISRLAVHKQKRVLLVRVRDILYIKVEDKIVFVFTEDGRFLINRTIIDLNNLLSAEGFFQVNRSTIINLDNLVEIIPWFSGTARLKLSNGLELSLSRERVPHLKELVGLSKSD